MLLSARRELEPDELGLRGLSSDIGSACCWPENGRFHKPTRNNQGLYDFESWQTKSVIFGYLNNLALIMMP